MPTKLYRQSKSTVWIILSQTNIEINFQSIDWTMLNIQQIKHICNKMSMLWMGICTEATVCVLFLYLYWSATRKWANGSRFNVIIWTMWKYLWSKSASTNTAPWTAARRAGQLTISSPPGVTPVLERQRKKHTKLCLTQKEAQKRQSLWKFSLISCSYKKILAWERCFTYLSLLHVCM